MTLEKIQVGTNLSSYIVCPSQPYVRTEGMLDSSFTTLKTKLTKDIFQVEDHIRDSHNSSHPKPSTTLLYILFGRLEKMDCKSIQVFEF